MSQEREIYALVAGGGAGQRFGRPKWDAPLAGRRILDYAIRPLASCYPDIRGITLLLPKSDVDLAQPPLLPEGMAFEVHEGGATRAESVLRGLEALRAKASEQAWVLVHDAARPCVWRADIKRLLEVTEPAGGLLAVPVTDTLKSDAEGQVEQSVNRQGLWRAQTPQMFPIALLHKALLQALEADFEVTDESSAMEHSGYHPRLVQGREDNIKVTWPEDLARAERILEDDPDDAYWTRL